MADASGLRLIFTNIDARSPERQFYIDLLVDGENQYHVTGCEPKIAGLDVMLEDVNKTNAFDRFVRNIRRQFCATVRK